MSRPDTSIYQNIKPIALPDPLQQAGKVLSIQQMIQQNNTEGLQQQNLQQQIDARQQANQRTDRAAKALSRAYAALPPGADADTKIQAGMEALQAEGLDKEAAEYGDTWAKYRESVAKQKAADRADHTAKLTDEQKKHELIGQSMGSLLNLSPEDQYAAYAHYYPGAVEHGLFDPNDPATPPPEQLNPEKITPVLSGLQTRAMTAQQQAELARQIANDTISNSEKKAQQARAEAETKKTEAEMAGTLPTEDERNYRANLPSIKEEFAASHKGRPPTDSEARAIFRQRLQKQTDLDKEIVLARTDPEFYAILKGHAMQGQITEKDIFDAQRDTRKEIEKDPLKDDAEKEAAYEAQRAAYKERFKIDIGPYKVAGTPPPPKAGQPATGAPVYKKGTSEIIGYFDGYDAQGRVKTRPKP